eukprot:COSAG05_NODE_12233_length_476_cov_1.090186_2_plen_22_part_01
MRTAGKLLRQLKRNQKQIVVAH